MVDMPENPKETETNPSDKPIAPYKMPLVGRIGLTPPRNADAILNRLAPKAGDEIPPPKQDKVR